MSTPTRPIVRTSRRSVTARPRPWPAARPPAAPPLAGCRSSGGQQEVEAGSVLGDVQDDPLQHAGGIVTAGIDAQGLPDLLHATRLVNVPVQPELRLVALDRVPDGMAADRN